jgi:ArsR family transcriptional regulator
MCFCQIGAAVTGRAELRERIAAGEAELFKALAHPARVRVLTVLVAGPATVAELCAATGLKPSHLAGQLAQLRALRLVTGRRSDGRLQYWLTVPEIADLLVAAGSVLRARAAADADGLADVGASSASAGGAGSEADNAAIFTDESAAVLEASLGRRALVTDAVRAVSARTGRNSEQVMAAFLAQARERGLTLAEVSGEAVAERRPE